MVPGCGRKAAHFVGAGTHRSHRPRGRIDSPCVSIALRLLADVRCPSLVTAVAKINVRLDGQRTEDPSHFGHRRAVKPSFGSPSGRSGEETVRKFDKCSIPSRSPVPGGSVGWSVAGGIRFHLLLSVAILSLFILAAAEAAQTQSRKILILPFRVSSDNQELQSFGEHVDKRLRSTLTPRDDTLILETEGVTEELLGGKEGPASGKEAQALAAKSGSELVIYGFLSQEGSAYHMQGVMWDVRAGRGAVSTDLKVDNIHKLPGVLDLFISSISTYLHGSPTMPFYRTEASPAGSGIPHSGRPSNLVSVPRNTGPWRSPDIASPLSGLDMGDLDGDKKNETVFLEQGKLTISRFENGILRQLTQFSQPPAEYIASEVADVDDDGISELLLCYQTPAGLESSVARYVSRNFRIIATFPNVILRTIRDPDDPKKRILVGQRTDDENMFSGDMTRFHVRGNDIVPAGKVHLPAGTLLLSYVSGALGKGPEFLQVILNQDQRLMVFDKENRPVDGASDRTYGLDRRIRIPFRQGYRTITYPGKLVIADTDGDGENKLLVIKQAADGSRIHALVWDGQRLVEKWKTVASPGIITDFGIKDFKNQGVRSLVLILMKPGAFSFLTGSRSVIYAYDLLP